MVENTEMRIDSGTGSVHRDYKTAFFPQDFSPKFNSKQKMVTDLVDHRELPILSGSFSFVMQFYVVFLLLEKMVK